MSTAEPDLVPWEQRQAEHHARALDLLGLEARPDASTCPRSLVGLPCLNVDPGACWCSSVMREHDWAYAHQVSGTPTILWEPYPYRMGPRALGPVLLGAFEDGLYVRRMDASPYLPGRTVAVAFLATGGGRQPPSRPAVRKRRTPKPTTGEHSDRTA